MAEDFLDPDIANLLGTPPNGNNESAPSFSELFGESSPVPDYDDFGMDAGSDPSSPQPSGEVLKKNFVAIEKFEEDPKPYFENKNFYKELLVGEGEISKKFHALLNSFLTCQNPQDRSLYRSRIIPAYWELYGSISTKLGGEIPKPKMLFLRYGLALPTLISDEQRNLISRIIEKNNLGETVHYADEWLTLIATGQANPSTGDEVKTSKNDQGRVAQNRLDKAKGQRDSQIVLCQSKAAAIRELEVSLAAKTELIGKHMPKAGYNGLFLPYNSTQRQTLSDINEVLKALNQTDKELEKAYGDLADFEKAVENFQRMATEAGAENKVDNKVITDEANTIRQMCKMAVGRQGNHFPLLMQQYFRASLLDVAVRENVIKYMAEIETLDPGLFMRTFKNQTQRIVPHVILLPCYGDTGVCWEPFERFNRATSKGRIAIPIFPKDVKTAVITALADLRWQVAKEKAAHYWMEEGITGKYYQWFSDRKLKGDVKEFFIQDYRLWITKESEGTQKLDREVRGIFWRNLPFPQDVRDNLKNRGFVYSELYKKDINRTMSDGY